jgi:4-hydroxyphenylpyruvate dioxygenase
MKDAQQNPCGLDGFAFLEFSEPNNTLLDAQFSRMGFKKTKSHEQADIHLYQQGDIQFIVNNSPNSQAAAHAKIHGAGACAMGFLVTNADKAYTTALQFGAKPFKEDLKAPSPHNLPGIQAIGGSVIYFVDKRHKPFMHHWTTQKDEPKKSQEREPSHANCGLLHIDHLTHNVHRGNMDTWANFYESIFGFKQIRFFNIEGQKTGLVSRAMGSPCGKIKIPLNESKDSVSQIEEFLHDYQGEGIQHIALSTDDIYQTVRSLGHQGVQFLDVPDTYYEMINKRIPWQKEPLDLLKEGRILIDGEKNPEAGLLLQIFTENVFGPVFFEIIQRRGNEGFGEGNFQALFEAIERDQIRRGTLK